MKYRDGCVMAGVLVFAVTGAVHAGVSESSVGTDEALCNGRAVNGIDCPGTAGSEAAVALAGRPALGNASAVESGARASRQAAERAGGGKLAVAARPERAQPFRGEGAASLLFWVIGSGLIGLAFAARRRDVRPQDT
ncbi:MAG: hypothetical protein PVI91_02085 [Gammaproteobacteria bacterium]